MAERTRVLVTFASKMGSTQEIAEAIGRELEDRGLQVTVAPCADNVSPEEFDGVIIGSAIYTGAGSRPRPNTSKRHGQASTARGRGCSTAARAGKGAREQVQAPKAVGRVISPLGLSAPVTFGGRLDLDHAIGPVRVGGWAPRDPCPGTFGTGTASVPGPPTLPASSIRRPPASSNDAAGETRR